MISCGFREIACLLGVLRGELMVGWFQGISLTIWRLDM